MHAGASARDEAVEPSDHTYDTPPVILSVEPEPAQIVEALHRVRDAQLLAFIEMSTAEAGGSSRETALRELDVQMPIVERELAQVDAWLDAIE